MRAKSTQNTQSVDGRARLAGRGALKGIVSTSPRSALGLSLSLTTAAGLGPPIPSAKDTSDALE